MLGAPASKFVLAIFLRLVVGLATNFKQDEVRLPIGPLLARQIDYNTADYYLGYKQSSNFDTLWAKYYNDTFPELSPQFVAALASSPYPSPYGELIADAGEALNQPGYLDLEEGFVHLDDGTLELAIHTNAPGNLTGDMLDWWFTWHTNDTRKYKLWYPGAHQYAILPSPLPDSKKTLPTYRDRYINVTSLVDEYIGPNALELSIGFYQPSNLGFSTSNPSTGVEALVSAFVVLLAYVDQDEALVSSLDFGPLSVVLVHQLRAKPDGTGKEFRSRFWFGQGIIAATTVVGGIETIARALGQHTYSEMSHLATFLPALYKEFKDDIPTGY